MNRYDSAELLSGSWNYPTSMIFGVDTVLRVPNLCKEQGLENPLLVCDKGIVDLPFVHSLVSEFTSASISLGVFSDVKTNPTGKNINDGVVAFKRGNHDAVIALGGGSALDAGKAIALMSGQDRALWDFEDEGDNWTRVLVDGVAPIIALPTTSGTGSEVGRASVIVDEQRKKKVIIFHPKMLPTMVVCDPKLTIGLPPAITAATGVDAFVHCFEAYCAPGFHPMADGIALEGMRLIKENLLIAYTDGSNLVARANMMAASSMGATAFQKGLGAVHALAHPLGAIFDKHHGLLNAILLPFVIQRNMTEISSKLENIARYLQLDVCSAEGFIEWMMSWRRGLGIPCYLKDIGIGVDRAGDIGQFAVSDPSASGNPIPLTAAEYTEVFIQAVG
ncbi:alcohol dehydrogenase [Gammaproteobacteria bacterium 42_54_T18]|nr:alcohol dehydrogenase [Gammaproteobacteria bacterium 42_54_T18]